MEVRAGAEVFRTPSVHGSHQPAWNWDFDLRLPAPIGTTRGALLVHLSNPTPENIRSRI